MQGQTQAIFELSGVKSITEIIIADIDIDVILGLDFLKANKCQIDAATDTLKIKGQSCKLNMTGKVGCYRVTVSETVEVPSRSEMVIEGKVTVPRIRKDDLGLVEPIECSFKSGNGLVAKTLVHTNDTIPLRVMNLSDNDEKLYAGKHVANLSFVTGVHKVKCPGTTTRGCNQVPSHLKDLYEETIIGLSPEQCDEVAKLLQKHESTFSKSDVDLGRTGIIRHRITTGDARPIKQPIRRLPHHMNQEAEQQINDMLEKDVIQPSSSPWASGIVLVQKKDGSKDSAWIIED